MIDRILQTKLQELSKKYPIVTLTGPRQSGKSTLLRHAFPDYKYVSLEDPDIRLFATEDPEDSLPPTRIKQLSTKHKEYLHYSPTSRHTLTGKDTKACICLQAHTTSC